LGDILRQDDIKQITRTCQLKSHTINQNLITSTIADNKKMFPQGILTCTSPPSYAGKRRKKILIKNQGGYNMSTLLEKIMEDIDSGKIKKLDLEDSFCFECQRCNKCCRNTDVLLTPYDIARLRTRLTIGTYRFLKRYGFEYFGPDSGLPLVMLNRGTDGSCPFLTKSGCSVYEDRPGSCRNYPLIRRIESETNKVEYFLQQPPAYCNGHQTNHYQTVRKWIKVSKLEEYHQYNDWFMRMLFRLGDVRKKFSWEMLVIIGEYFYNFDLMALNFAKQNGLAQPKTDQEKFKLIEKAIEEFTEDEKK